MQRRFDKRARYLRNSQTAAETLLWRQLRNRRLGHWKFRRQHPIDRFTVDFVTLSGRPIVEIDGATHSSREELARDAERTLILESLGFHVMRVTNADIRENLDGVLETILAELMTI
jgi:very-short-patch-repair endonuclease